jgi:hypothetical protein
MNVNPPQAVGLPANFFSPTIFFILEPNAQAERSAQPVRCNLLLGHRNAYTVLIRMSNVMAFAAAMASEVPSIVRHRPSVYQEAVSARSPGLCEPLLR